MSEEGGIDIEQLDLAARCLNGEDLSMTPDEANQILCDFKADSESYLFVRPILENSTQLLVKNTVLQALISSIERGWNCIEDSIQEEIRSFLFEFVIKSSLDLDREIAYKGRKSLIAILDKVYTSRWHNFLSEAWEFTEGNPEFITNYMLFISDFFGHVINDAGGKITRALASSLENCIRQNGLREVMQSITEILNNGETPPYLARASLEAMSFCVKWRFPFDLFQSDFYSNLCTVFLTNADLALDSVKVLTNIASRIAFPEGQEGYVIQIFGLIMNALAAVTDGEEEGSLPTPEIGANFIEALKTIFNHYGYIIDCGIEDNQFQNALNWAWGITTSSDGPLFELTFEFWESICERLVMNFGQGIENETYLQYAPLLRRLLIAKMPIPFAISETVDVFGNTTKKVLSGTEISNGYVLMRRCLAMLTKIDEMDTIAALEERYQELMDAGDLSAERFGAFCWAVAATSGSFGEDNLSVVQDIISTLAGLINDEENVDDNDRVQVGLGFIYICSEYNKLVASDQDFFAEVMQLIISLAISENADLQTVGIDTVSFMARRCREAFFKGSESIYDLMLQDPETLYSKMLDNDGRVNLFNIFSNLTMHFKASTGERRTYMETFLAPVNQLWEEVTRDFNPSDAESCDTAVQMLNIFARVPVNLADEWTEDFQQQIPTLMNIYQQCVEFLQEAVQEGSPEARTIQAARSVTAAIITVAHNFLYGTSKPLEIETVVSGEFMDMLLSLYGDIEPLIRVPQTIDFFATVIVRLENEFMPRMPLLFEKLYHPTIAMIREDFDAFTDFRPDFFRLMMAIVNGCPQSVLGLDQEELFEFIECAKWGCQHPQEEVSKYCFSVLQSTINMIIESKDDDIIGFFYAEISVDTTIFVLDIVTNVTYKFALDEAARLFHFMLKLPALFEGQRDEALNQRIAEEFADQDPTIFTDLLQRVRVGCTSEDATIQAVRDFLVRVREISPFDPQLRRAEASARLRRLNNQQIAGIVSEHEKQLREEVPDDATLRFMEQIKNMHIHKK